MAEVSANLRVAATCRYVAAAGRHGSMPSVTSLLDVLAETLGGIEAQWRRLGAPIIDGLRPGLDDATMDSVAAGFGWSLPPELRVWYRWHDGADQSRRRSIGPAGYQLLTLQEALQATARSRGEFADAAPLVWPHEWFVFMTQGAQRLYLDTTQSPSRVSTPLGLVSWMPENMDVDRAGSLLEAASLWLWLLEQGFYRVEQGGDLVAEDWASLPLWLRLSGLA